MKFALYLFRLAPGLTLSAILIGSLGGVCGAVLMKQINSQLDPAHVADDFTSLPAFSLVILILIVTGFLSRLLMSSMTEKISYELRMTLCRQILATPLRQLENEGFGKILGILTQDVSSLGNALLQVPTMCINAATLLGCMVYLYLLSPQILIVVIVFMALAVVSVKLPERPADRRLDRARGHLNRLVDHLHAQLDGIKELKLNRSRRRNFYHRSIEATADAYRKDFVSSLRIHAATNSWIQALYFLLVAFLIYGLSDHLEVTTTVLTGYILTVLFMRGPFVQMIDTIPIFARASVSLRNVESMGLTLASADSPWRDPANDRRPPERVEIELRGVTHSYFREREESEFTLGPIDLTLRSGEIVFLVGGNGSGKTTLAKILTGLYPPSSGQVLLNGEPVAEADLDDYRQCFSAVYGDFHLFEQLLEAPAGDHEAMSRQLLAKLHLDHKVTVAEGALSTTRLSQGQRKRLALLNAYLEDRPVYVFDEWAADQDPEFKVTFYRVLLPELRARGKAVLVISHDDRYYDAGDRIVKLDFGQLVTAQALESKTEH